MHSKPSAVSPTILGYGRMGNARQRLQGYYEKHCLQDELAQLMARNAALATWLENPEEINKSPMLPFILHVLRDCYFAPNIANRLLSDVVINPHGLTRRRCGGVPIGDDDSRRMKGKIE